ncbi:hypothetical protein D3C80_1494700 [compost metagenome]
MPCPTRSELLKLVTEIVFRYCNTPERINSLLTLATASKLQINFRTSLYSKVGCLKLWDFIDVQTNISDPEFMEILMNMTGEMLFIAEVDDTAYNNELAGPLARSLAWVKDATGTPDALREMSATADTYREILNLNKWAAFVYLMSMTDLMRILTAMKHEAAKG